MTLNITAITPNAIHQTADFLISRTERDANGNWVELQKNSSKIVTLRYQRWFGFLTYCGVGLWKGKRTDEYVVEWLSDLNSANPDFLTVLERVRDHGSSWLGEVKKHLRRTFAHTFVLAGFENALPIFAVASNYQSLTAYSDSYSDHLVSDVRITKNSHLLITGIRDAVSKNDRLRLKAVLRSGVPANLIRHEMAMVNRNAAQSKQAKNGISSACLAYSIDVNGGGAGRIYGEVEGPLIPRTQLDGIDLNSALSEFLKSMPNAQFVQTVFATGESSKAAVDEVIGCVPDLRENSLYTIEEIGAINDFWLSLHAINDCEWVVGQIQSPVGALPQAFARIPGRGYIKLGTFGGQISHAFSVNNKNQVIGSAEDKNHHTHAYVWSEKIGMVDLGTLGGDRSVARDINNNGEIVGESNAGSKGQSAERAFLWNSSDGMVNLGEAFEGWSRTVAINDEGLVLGSRQRGGAVSAFVWSRALGMVDVPGQDGRSLYPTAMNALGMFVGEGDDQAGSRRTFVWTRGEGLNRLSVPDKFHPADIDDFGRVLGNVHSTPWPQPAIYDMANHIYHELPTAGNHQTSVKAWNRKGSIIGLAHIGSFKHWHALVWRLRATLPNGQPETIVELGRL